MSEQNKLKIINKAIIVENDSQLRKVKKMFKKASMCVIFPSVAEIQFPHYEMICAYDSGIFAIPNYTLKGTDTGIYELGFEVCTINQLKTMLGEE